MTVQYADTIASQDGFGSIFKLLLRWRGSIYKSVWQELILYLGIYYIISFVYRYGLPDPYMRWFEQLVIYIAEFRNLIPVSFVLGFYVSLVVDRWWGTYKSLPWPDTTATLVNTHVGGTDDISMAERSALLRYVNLTIALTFIKVSPVVEEEFPSLEALRERGYLTQEELLLLQKSKDQTETHITYVPIMWACKIISKARCEGRIRSSSAQKMLLDELLSVRGRCGAVIGWVDNNIPLVYTQVVTIAVYSFFLFSLIGEQYIDPAQGYSGYGIDLFVPLSGILQLVFYMGWIKVAESLLNPFGDDDHDFELVALLKRHWEMSKLLGQTPERDIPSIARTDGTNFTNFKMVDDDIGDNDYLVTKTNSINTLKHPLLYSHIDNV